MNDFSSPFVLLRCLPYDILSALLPKATQLNSSHSPGHRPLFSSPTGSCLTAVLQTHTHPRRAALLPSIARRHTLFSPTQLFLPCFPRRIRFCMHIYIYSPVQRPFHHVLCHVTSHHIISHHISSPDLSSVPTYCIRFMDTDGQPQCSIRS